MAIFYILFHQFYFFTFCQIYLCFCLFLFLTEVWYSLPFFFLLEKIVLCQKIIQKISFL